MILVLGGTAETAEICKQLIPTKLTIHVSTATDCKLALPKHDNLKRINGRKTIAELCDYIRGNDIRTLICAVHPYASAARNNALIAADKCSITPYTFIREATDLNNYSAHIIHANSHSQAAKLACQNGKNIFLTTGSRNLTPYLKQAEISNCNIFARVLDCEESKKTVDESCLKPENIIYARGPFSIEDNLRDINRVKADILVTKDGAKAGGLQQKLEAAARLNLKVIVVKRPKFDKPFFSDINKLISQLISDLQSNGKL